MKQKKNRGPRIQKKRSKEGEEIIEPRGFL